MSLDTIPNINPEQQSEIVENINKEENGPPERTGRQLPVPVLLSRSTDAARTFLSGRFLSDKPFQPCENNRLLKKDHRLLPRPHSRSLPDENDDRIPVGEDSELLGGDADRNFISEQLNRTLPGERGRTLPTVPTAKGRSQRSQGRKLPDISDLRNDRIYTYERTDTFDERDNLQQFPKGYRDPKGSSQFTGYYDDDQDQLPYAQGKNPMTFYLQYGNFIS